MPRRRLLLTPIMLLVPAPACSTVTHLFSGGGSTLAGQAEGTPVLPPRARGPTRTPHRSRAATPRHPSGSELPEES